MKTDCIEPVDTLYWQATVLVCSADIMTLLSRIDKNKQQFNNTQGLGWQSQALKS